MGKIKICNFFARSPTGRNFASSLMACRHNFTAGLGAAVKLFCVYLKGFGDDIYDANDVAFLSKYIM